MENLNNDYRSQLIMKNVGYYGKQFASLDEGGKKATWNWFAFVVPFCWFAYRKLYAECIAYYIITNGLHTVINQILASHGLVMNVGWTIDILSMLFSGLYANWLYKMKIDRNVEKCISLPEEKREKYIRRNGGTSVIAVIIAFCITIALAAVIYKFTGGVNMNSEPI